MSELDVIRGKIRERMNDISDAMTDGACKSYDHYRYACGVIEGLAHAERDILDMKAAQEKQND